MRELIYDLFERYQLVRRLTLLWSVCVTTVAVRWSFEFASAGGEGGVIAAVMAPISALQGWVMQIYTYGRKEA